MVGMSKGAENVVEHQEHQGEQAVTASVDQLARVIVDAGLTVHKALGPGLFESTYEHCLAFELKTRGLSARRQVAMPIVYTDVKLNAGYRDGHGCRGRHYC